MSDPTSTSHRSRTGAPAALVYGALTVLLSVVVVLVVRQMRTTAQARTLDATLARHTARLRSHRTERPAVMEGTAAPDCDSVLDALRALPDLSAAQHPIAPLFALLARGEPLPTEFAALATAHTARLDDFLNTSRCLRMRVSSPLATSSPMPRYGDILRGAALVLQRDRAGDPVRCLDSIVRVSRLLSDLPYAGGYVGLALSGLPREAVANVALRCARRATPPQVAAAQQRLAAVAAPPLPEGEILVFERLAMMHPLRDIVMQTPAFPTNADALQSWWYRPRFVQGWESLATGLDDLPARITTPGDTVDQLDETDRILGRIMPSLAGTSNALRIVERGRTGLAWTRMLAVALDALGRPRTDPDPAALPMPDLRAPAARDPFSRRDPLRWARSHRGGFLAWSAGPDGRDDRGSNDDLVLTIPGPDGAPEAADDHGHDHGHNHGAPQGPGAPAQPGAAPVPTGLFP